MTMTNPQPQQQPVPAQIVYVQPVKKKVNHGLHLFLTLLTFGLWLPVWLIVSIAA